MLLLIGLFSFHHISRFAPKMAKDSCHIVQQNRGPLNCTAADRAAVLQDLYSLLQSFRHLLTFLLSFSVVCTGNQDLASPVDTEGFQNDCNIVCDAELLRFHFDIRQDVCFSRELLDGFSSSFQFRPREKLCLEVRRKICRDSGPIAHVSSGSLWSLMSFCIYMISGTCLS